MILLILSETIPTIFFLLFYYFNINLLGNSNKIIGSDLFF